MTRNKAIAGVGSAEAERLVGIHRNGAIDTDDTAPAPKRTREQAAELILRSMVADMRQQGWTLSNDQADEMVARLRKEILQ